MLFEAALDLWSDACDDRAEDYDAPAPEFDRDRLLYVIEEATNAVIAEHQGKALAEAMAEAEEALSPIAAVVKLQSASDVARIAARVAAAAGVSASARHEWQLEVGIVWNGANHDDKLRAYQRAASEEAAMRRQLDEAQAAAADYTVDALRTLVRNVRDAPEQLLVVEAWPQLPPLPLGIGRMPPPAAGTTTPSEDVAEVEMIADGMPSRLHVRPDTTDSAGAFRVDVRTDVMPGAAGSADNLPLVTQMLAHTHGVAIPLLDGPVSLRRAAVLVAAAEVQELRSRHMRDVLAGRMIAVQAAATKVRRSLVAVARLMGPALVSQQHADLAVALGECIVHASVWSDLNETSQRLQSSRGMRSAVGGESAAATARQRRSAAFAASLVRHLQGVTPRLPSKVASQWEAAGAAWLAELERWALPAPMEVPDLVLACVGGAMAWCDPMPQGAMLREVWALSECAPDRYGAVRWRELAVVFAVTAPALWWALAMTAVLGQLAWEAVAAALALVVGAGSALASAVCCCRRADVTGMARVVPT